MHVRLGLEALTAVGVAPLLQVGVAVQAAVGGRDVLRGPRDGRLRHHRVGLGRLVHGLELQPLVVDPQVGGLQVFGVPFVLVGAVGRLGGGAFSTGAEGGEEENAESLEETHPQRGGGREVLTSSDGTWCAACRGRPPPPPK